jgi:heparan-alpha-glucosaminide N-acetyltransferase
MSVAPLPVAPAAEETLQQTFRLPKAAARNVAMDAYRGLVMFLMMAEVLRLSRVAAAFPGNWFWQILA